MLNERDIKEILDYRSSNQVVSLYLNTEPANGNADAYRLQLRSLLKGVDAAQDIQRIEQYFNHEYDWSGKSVAVFSCAADHYFKAFPLAVPVRSRVRISDHPHFKPLADLWDEYGGYGVALVDKQGVRLFHFNMGVLEEQEGYLGEEVKHIKHGEASSLTGRRAGAAGKTSSEDEIENRNLKGQVNFSAKFFEDKRIRRILIGGTDENIARFREQLPKTWQSLIVGSFHSPITASHAEVQSKAYQAGAEAEKKREASLVDAAITAAAKGGAGMVGVEETLHAVSNHRVSTLLVQEGFFSSGVECNGCGRLSGHITDQCPVCGNENRKLLDVIDTAVVSVLQSGGDVEIVHESAPLEAAGRVAALLRY